MVPMGLQGVGQPLSEVEAEWMKVAAGHGRRPAKASDAFRETIGTDGVDRPKKIYGLTEALIRRR